MMLAQSITLGVISFGYPRTFSVEAIFWLVGACFIVVGLYYSLVLPKLAKDREKSMQNEEGVHPHEV
jgi:hypothetical protein